MMGRDKYPQPLKCAKCGNTGIARFSEENMSEGGEWFFNVDSVPEGFHLANQPKSADTAIINCDSCGLQAN